MRSYAKSYLVGVGGSFLVGIVMPLFAFAQGQVGITVTPLTFELTANPGETITNQVQVTNPTAGSIIFEMEVEDFTAVGESGEVVIETGGDETFSLKKWITTIPRRFTVEAGQTQVVSFSLSVPTNAEPGGHYGTILATVKGSVNGTGAAIAQQVGTLVLMTVSGQIREELFIREFTVPSFSSQGPIPFIIRLENTGSVHIKPIGFISISNFWGEKVVDIPLPARRVLPGSARRIDLTWDKRYPVGKYTATLVGVFGISNTPITAVTTFWVFPWKIALEITGALAALLVVLVKTRKRFRRALNILLKGEGEGGAVA